MKRKARSFFRIYQGNPQVALIIFLLAALLLMAFTRMLLYFFNTGLFPDHHAGSLLRLGWFGLRFDLSAILYANLAVILLMLIPFRFRYLKTYQSFTRFLFVLSNGIALIPNLADSIYFRFTMKRLTGDIFTYLGVGSDMNLFLRFMIDFWYIFLLWFLLLGFLVWFSRKISLTPPGRLQGRLWYYSGQTLMAAFMGGLIVLGLRGGTQLKPIGIMNAAVYAEAQDIPIVLNSAFTIMRTLDQKGLEKKQYFKEESEALKYFNPEQSYLKTDSLGNPLPMNRKNIVMIIMESFSREHIGFYQFKDGNKQQGFTPFLDSLSTHCLNFEGFANGKRSIEGIPAILGGLPTWMDQDFITSLYAANKTNSLATLLRAEGYSSAFFHGGTNGTMGFSQYAKSAGFDHYYGRTEYNNEKDYDGHWGIWDEPYFQHFAARLNQMKTPFIASVFSLSSHHPYKVPEKYKNRFRKGKLAIQETIMYSDYALQQFFKTASRMPWYQNTLFVITADHTSEAWDPASKTRVGQYRIPVMFFAPSESWSETSPLIMQQTDIMPTILDYLGYPGTFIAFGNSVFDKQSPRFGLSRVSESYQLVMGDHVLQWNEAKKPELYNFKSDPLLGKSLELPAVTDSLQLLLKSVIQQYNNRMIENRLISR